jgi:hypothetical protein
MSPFIEKNPLASVAQTLPGKPIRERPWHLIGMALAFGLAAGLLLRYRSVRKAVAIYLLARRVF